MLFDYGLCLPSGSNMTKGELEKVLYYLKKVLGVGD
jgi:hypothetical protein